MILQEIIEKIEEKYPLEYACDWDNSGLQAGDRASEVKTVYITVDPTGEEIEAAKKAGAQLILTHHPLIFGGIKKVTTDDVVGNRVLKVLSYGMNSYAMHTNYDSLGMAQLSADKIGLKEVRVLEEVYQGEGIGRVGLLPNRMTLKDLAELVKEAFDLPNVKIFGDPEKEVLIAAISPGSGKSMTGIALESGADVLITGDIDHHTGIDAAEQGLCIIDAGHYGIEHIYIEDMKHFLKMACPELKVTAAKIRQPFEVI